MPPAPNDCASCTLHWLDACKNDTVPFRSGGLLDLRGWRLQVEEEQGKNLDQTQFPLCICPCKMDLRPDPVNSSSYVHLASEPSRRIVST